MESLPLFDYPRTPGWKKRDTSREAAESITPRAETLEQMCYRVLRLYDLSADEVADLLEEDILSIRPRISALAAKNLVCDSGKRTVNARSKKKAIVWTAK